MEVQRREFFLDSDLHLVDILLHSFFFHHLTTIHVTICNDFQFHNISFICFPNLDVGHFKRVL